jgi:hypothetical protein
MELRVQQRMLFPKAPGWSPFSKLHVKALRFAPARQRDIERPVQAQQLKKKKILRH